jgi:lysophospholipase L1-like esterase
MTRVLASMFCGFGALAMAFAAGAAEPHRARPQTWITAWGSSPQASEPNPKDPLLSVDGQTVRQRVRVSVGGAQIRILLSNQFGAAPVTVGAATVGLAADPASVKPGSIRPLTFGGRRTVTIPPGAPVLSDPVALPVAAGEELSLSLYFPQAVPSPTVHSAALKRAVVTGPGDFTGAEHVEAKGTSTSSMLVSAVLVAPARSTRVLVALGDSITDGIGSSVEADSGWTSDLVRRVAKSGLALAVVNQGIGGNQLSHEGFGQSALARFDRDVLAQAGVTHVVVLEGTNDIGFPGVKLGGKYLADPADVRTPDELIGAYRQLIARAHAHGLRIVGATLTPFEGTTLPGYYSEAKEATRQAVNAWIRSGGAFDGVIDFDAALRDPAHPTRLQARYASGDNLHPNDAGHQAMADAVDLSLFK